MNILKSIKYIFIGFPLILLDGIYKEFGSPKIKGILIYLLLALVTGLVFLVLHYL
jgi:hypothetical protein